MFSLAINHRNIFIYSRFASKTQKLFTRNDLIKKRYIKLIFGFGSWKNIPQVRPSQGL